MSVENKGTGAVDRPGRDGGIPFRAAQRDGLTCRGHGPADLSAPPQGGLTPAEFHAHWRDVHGPLIAASTSGRHVLRYEQHPRPLDDYPATTTRASTG